MFTPLQRTLGSRLSQVPACRSSVAAPRAMMHVHASQQRHISVSAHPAQCTTRVSRPSLVLAPGLASAQRHFRSTLHRVAAAATEAPAETYEYQAEVDRLMDMIVNSLYSNRDVFLRELISNSSDALDKARFISLTNPAVMVGNDQLEIRISADKEKNQIIIQDSGIGMTREQLLSNLGTIARSGTRKFMEAMKEAKGDANLIGQFGVGFYSSFLVADRVTVETKSHEEDKAYVWESTVGSHTYTIKDAPVSDLVRGTRVVLHLKEDAVELADPVRLARLIKMYSQFIQFPIKLLAPKKEAKKVVDEEATTKAQEEEDKKATEEGREPTKVEAVTKTEYEDVLDWRVENENKPIWTRNPKEVEPEAYNEFFKQTFGEFLDPLAHIHFNVEGTIEFSSILYIPGMAPFEQQNPSQRPKSMKLFVKRVFISDEFDEDLMPRYLSFVRGVIDSSDLPLNVSREILQESRIVRVMRKQLVRRSLEMMEDLAKKEGGEDYKTFFENFGRNIKIGIIEDVDNRPKLAKLLRFFSSKSEDAMISLDDYIKRMKPDQKAIYYMAGDSVEAAKTAPFVEGLVSAGYEILYLIEPIDEACLTNLGKFDEKDLIDVSKEGVEVDGLKDKEEAAQKAEEQLKPLLDFLKSTLGDRVEKVNVSRRLTDSPCALSTSKFGWSANMERIMRSQAMGDTRSMEYMRGRKILEVNPNHDILKGLKTLLDEKDTDRAADIAELLYETALLTSGFNLESPKDYAGKVYLLMKAVLGYDLEEESSSQPISSSAATSEPIEPEVLGDDPWKGKN